MPTVRPAILGGLASVAVLVLGAAFVIAQQAEDRARAEAAAEAALLDVARQIRPRTEAVAGAADEVTDAAIRLQNLLVEHLSAEARPEPDLRAERDAALAALRAAADDLALAGSATLPRIPLEVQPRAVEPSLDALQELLARARATADAASDAVADVTPFTTALDGLFDASADFVRRVNARPASTDPDELATAWRAELTLLDEYETAVDVAAGTPGLGRLAAAHAAYVAGSRELAEDAVVLLRAGDIDGYNEHVDAVLEQDDPFGFAAAVAAGTRDALEAPAIAELTGVARQASETSAAASRVPPLGG